MAELTDPYLWLEDITGEAALEWARKHNDTAETALAGSAFETTRARIRDALDTDERIPYVRRRGEFLYNFWRDAQNPRGLWRRTTLPEYRREQPQWQILLDVDELAKSEDENWVWGGATVLRPSYDRALISLSRGGADAAVVREFDLEELAFVADGFSLPEAKSEVRWVDRDAVFVGTDFGDDTLTESGYPRIAKLWRRGAPLAEAETVFEGQREDVAVSAWRDLTPGYERSFAERAIDFYSSERFLLTDDGQIAVDVPLDARVSVHREWLLIYLRSAWTIGGAEFPAGALLSAPFDDYLAGERDVTAVFLPDAHTSLQSFSWTANWLVLELMRDVRSELRILTPGTWTGETLPGLPPLDTAEVVDTDPDNSDEIFISTSGYTSPATLWHGSIGAPIEVIKALPPLFDARDIVTEQHFAMSEDGTAVPYFLVRRADAPSGPTMLYGYGGFQNSLTPAYSAALGRAWLERGGAYAVANTRGGGEYGPDWHTQALRENRHRVFEDFAAVAKDLVERGVTTPQQLGIQGGSNGGLLMGVMLTKYPELFGAIVCQVPLLDMRRYHLLLAGASWVAEYGDPDEPGDWDFLSTYSPYQAVSPNASYPPTLIMTSTRDDRVHPGHARKMVARLEEYGHRVLYFENIEGGHGGAADNAQLAHKAALAYEFLWRTLDGPKNSV
ncbi:prolyl oligopeptidase family serine peptidase [Hoyosella sp. YIM 151337]|uniref:prolyl oligopeptidase family serine peptidase n=1 Tax=Hoyosella sp. YIM 151337 TaxID=2992742 RepID=UPI002235976C|nr:prolyl oligopeptidase family serine peptidase [Hoyosella sp. YIM 151337]MCW4352375.1 prolyl oligopeptidase family serine peptidase [Hoyosella sp. YIM 151337]